MTLNELKERLKSLASLYPNNDKKSKTEWMRGYNSGAHYAFEFIILLIESEEDKAVTK